MSTVPGQVRVAPLSEESLRAPLVDRTRYAPCGLPDSTRVKVKATIQDGSTILAEAHTAPADRALDFCIAQIVREISWERDPVLHRVEVSF